jgi:hypothetical protein
MKLSKWLETYQWFSAKLSDVNRQLAFAGIALVWAFRLDAKPVPGIPKELFLAVSLLVLGLALDLLHYAYSTAVWGFFHRYHEARSTGDPDIEAPRCLNWPPLVIAWGKVAAVAAAYVCILFYIGPKWWAML